MNVIETATDHGMNRVHDEAKNELITRVVLVQENAETGVKNEIDLKMLNIIHTEAGMKVAAVVCLINITNCPPFLKKTAQGIAPKSLPKDMTVLMIVIATTKIKPRRINVNDPGPGQEDVDKASFLV